MEEEGTGIDKRGEDFRAYSKFQTCHYTTGDSQPVIKDIFVILSCNLRMNE